MGHAAVLIGSEKNGWTYISKDGYTGVALLPSSSKYVVKQFATLEEFTDSPHNYELKSGYHSTKNGTEADSFNYELDSDGNKIVRYDQTLRINTIQEDGSSTDEAAKEAATKSAKSKYKAGKSDCSHVVQAALDASLDSEGNQVQNGEGKRTKKPNTKFDNIKKRNPKPNRTPTRMEQIGPGSLTDEMLGLSTGLGTDPGASR